jgi:spermidine/putrescine transport system substrate-binding protein
MKKALTLILLLIVLVGVMSCQPRQRRVLYVFNWTDYIAPELIRKFERQYNCRVVYDTYNSNENMLTRLLTSRSAYDIIVPTGDHVAILVEKGLLEHLDQSLLTNYHNLNPDILKKALEYNLHGFYGVPYFWGTSGLIYNRRYLSDEEMENVSWNILADERFTGKNVITMLDDLREVLGAALIHNGYSPNETSRVALTKARLTLHEWDKNIAQFDSDSFKNEIQDGTIWLGQAYNGDALQVMSENDDIGFVLPIEGSTLWIDFLAIPKNSQNKDLAHQFINFLLDEKVGLINTKYVMYATPNKATYELLPEEIRHNRNIYPSAEYLERSGLIKHIGDDIIRLNEIWQEIRNN